MMTKAKPFIKWVGGKSQLLEQFDDYYPLELRTGALTRYAEPFLGSGAVFFELAQRYKIETAYLSDLNRDLILTYTVVQQRPHDLLLLLERYQKAYHQTDPTKRQTLFLTIRDEFNQQR